MTNAEASKIFGAAVPVPGDLHWSTGIDGRRADAHQRARILRDAESRMTAHLIARGGYTHRGTCTAMARSRVSATFAALRQETIGNGQETS